jgi:hypothetical protein
VGRAICMGVVPIRVDIMDRADHGDGGLDPPGPMGTAAVPAGTAVLAEPVTNSVEDPIRADITARIDTDRPGRERDRAADAPPRRVGEPHTKPDDLR